VALGAPREALALLALVEAVLRPARERPLGEPAETPSRPHPDPDPDDGVQPFGAC
jgi:hypothetical protein